MTFPLPKIPSQWYVEVDKSTKGFFAAIDEVYVVKKTKYQECQLVHSPAHGKVLFLDGRVQSTEYDEKEYHEYLVQPAMFFHPRPESILIIGGGEGAVAREVLKHRSVKHVVMVDIDSEAVAFCRKYLTSWHQGAFDDRRLKLVFADARKYIARTREKFDVIIVDLSEPVADGPATFCYTREFFLSLGRRINPGGICMVQSDAVSLDSNDFYPHLYKTLHQSFGEVHTLAFFLACINCLWSATLCTTSEIPTTRTFSELDVDGIAQERHVRLHFYDSIMHRRISSLPVYVRNSQRYRNAKVLTDRNIRPIVRKLSINQ